MNLSVRILMQKKGVKFSHIAPDHVTGQTLSRMMKGDRTISVKTLAKVASLLNASEYLNYLYALDQLYLAGQNGEKLPTSFPFPEFVPKDVRLALKAFHPLFSNTTA